MKKVLAVLLLSASCLCFSFTIKAQKSSKSNKRISKSKTTNETVTVVDSDTSTYSRTSFTTKAKYSNKQVVWYEYPYWLDGSLLRDAKNKDKFNDILFKKVGNRYYKTQVDGAYNVEDWGLKKDYEQAHSQVDNSALLQAMINYFPVGYTASIYFPTGNYFF